MIATADDGSGPVRGRELRGLIAFGMAIACVHAVRPTASYKTLELGGTAASVGIVAASYAVLSALAAVPLGRSIDRRGSRSFVVGGIVLLAGGAVLSGLAPSVAVLAVAQSFLGLGQISAAIAFQTITAHDHADDRDRGFARLTVAASIGQLLGPAAAGGLLERSAGGGSAAWLASGTATVFGIAAAVALASVAVAWRTGSGPATVEPAGTGRQSARTPVRSIVRRPGMLQALITSITVLTALDLLIAYLPVLGEARGIGPGSVGILLSLRAAAGLASRVSMSVLIRWLGRRRLLLGAMTAAGISMLVVALSPLVWGIGAAIAMVGFGLGLGSPMTMAWVSERAPANGRGTALAVRMTGNRVGQVLVPAAVGGLAAVLGPGAVFITLAGTLLACSTWVRNSPVDAGRD